MNAANFALPSEQINYWLNNAPDQAVLHQPVNGQYQTYTWKQIDEEARRFMSFLQAQGLTAGDKVAILSKNCAHWIIADLALMLGGYISVPIYPTANDETISFVLEHAECKGVIIGKLDGWEKQQSAIPSTIFKVGLPNQDMPVDHQWQDIMANHEPCQDTHAAKPEDMMTILYTSGSTGAPKGAMHSYASFVNSGKQTGGRLQATPSDRILSYLPLSHCTERNYVESVMFSYGSSMYFVESLSSFSENLNYCRPTVFGSVPRLWTQFQKTILTNVPSKKLNMMLKIPIISGMVKGKIKKQMGLDQARTFLSGSAPLSQKVLEWYRKIDIDIAEGWGMTESFACGSLTMPGKEVRFGTVSQPIGDADIVIADDDEILIKCDSTMMGYYKDEAKTAETMNEEGYVHTGDLGQITDGYLSIVGRKKDIFKTEKGKYVAPIPIESDFGENEYIEQMCLMGTQLVQPVLVINLSAHAAQLDKAEIEQSLTETMERINTKLEAHAKVGAIVIATSAWTTESGELTPTLKVKRHVVEKQFLPIAQKAGKGAISWH